MKKDQTTALVDINRYLEGTKFQGKVISHLCMVPTDHEGFAKFVHAIENDKGPVLDFINLDYDDFDVIAVLDFQDYHLTRNLQWKSLEYLLTH